MDLILNRGEKKPIVLIDYECAWARATDREQQAGTPFDIGFSILEATLDEQGRQKLVGEVRTLCPICGQVHEASRQYCELDFDKAPCPKGHNSWKARITSLKRRSEPGQSLDQIVYEFEAELYCGDCNKIHRRLAKSFKGTLANLKKVSIGLTGITIELRDEAPPE